MSLAALVLLGGPAASRAQGPGATSPADSARAALVAALRTAHDGNRLVRVHLAAGALLTGRVGEVTSATARVAAQPLPLDRVDSLAVRFTGADPVSQGAAIGALTGIALGFGGAMLASGLSEGNSYTKKDALATIALVGLTGAVFGAVVDAGFEGNPQWRTVWRR